MSKKASFWHEEARRYAANTQYWRARAERAENALREIIPKAWADDDTMDHIPGIKTARLLLAELEK